LRDFFLSPATSNRRQQRDQRRRRGRNYALAYAPLDQCRVLLEGCAEEGFARQKHDHKLWRRLKLLPVRFGTEPGHMVAHLPRMVGKFGSAEFLVLGFNRLEISLQRRLGIYNDELASGELDEQVGTEPIVAILDCDL